AANIEIAPTTAAIPIIVIALRFTRRLPVLLSNGGLVANPKKLGIAACCLTNDRQRWLVRHCRPRANADITVQVSLTLGYRFRAMNACGRGRRIRKAFLLPSILVENHDTMDSDSD